MLLIPLAGSLINREDINYQKKDISSNTKIEQLLFPKIGASFSSFTLY